MILATEKGETWEIRQDMVQQYTLINGVLTVSKGGCILLEKFHIEQAVAQDRAAISDNRPIASAGGTEITDVHSISLEAPPERVTAETGTSSESQPSGSTSLLMLQ